MTQECMKAHASTGVVGLYERRAPLPYDAAAVATAAAACAGAAGCAAARSSAAGVMASSFSRGPSCPCAVCIPFKHPGLHVTGRPPPQLPNMHRAVPAWHAAVSACRHVPPCPLPWPHSSLLRPACMFCQTQRDICALAALLATCDCICMDLLALLLRLRLVLLAHFGKLLHPSPVVSVSLAQRQSMVCPCLQKQSKRSKDDCLHAAPHLVCAFRNGTLVHVVSIHGCAERVSGLAECVSAPSHALTHD